MKIIFIKWLWFIVILTLCLVVVTLFSCKKSDTPDTPPETDYHVSFTPCRQNELKNDGEEANKLDVEYTDKGIQITRYNFEVSCDFTDISITHTFENGILCITLQGSPNQSNCICYTDVSFTINKISQYEINIIVINGMQYCYNENAILIPCPCVIELMKGEWNWTKTYTSKWDMIDNKFESKLKVLGQNEDGSVSYEIFVDDTLFYRSNFQLRQYYWSEDCNVVNIKLPHHNGVGNWGWGIYLGGMWMSPSSKEIITFWVSCDDCPLYYYEKK